MTDRVHICNACRQPFVVPEEILAILPAQAGYLMRLGCTNCGHQVIGTYDEDAMYELDCALERAQRQIRAAADELAARPLWTGALAEA